MNFVDGRRTAQRTHSNNSPARFLVCLYAAAECVTVLEHVGSANFSPGLETWRSEVSAWTAITAADLLMEGLVEMEDPVVRRARVISWLLFVLTIPDDDAFFTAPIFEESPHPYRPNWQFQKTLCRPGATALEVDVQDLRFAPLSRDSISFFADAGA